MLTEDVNIDTLVPYARNPRCNDRAIDGVAASIKEFGFLQPVVIDKNNVIIAGHTRLLAAKKLGLENVPTVRADALTASQVQAYRLIDNKLSELAEWDEELLTLELNELSEFPLSDFSCDFSGDIANPAIDTRDAEVAPPPQTPQTSSGDLWRLGSHRLLCGDATSELDYFHLFDVRYGATIAKQAALLVTDPPYGVSYADKNKFLNTLDKGCRIQVEIRNDHATADDMHLFWRKTFTTALPFLSNEASYYVTGPQGGDLLLLLLALRESGFALKHMLIWVKNAHVLSRCDYNYRHEPILFGWKEKGTHHFYGSSENSVWEIARPSSFKLHPTMKPIELYLRAMRNSSLEGEVVLDPFMGSGTALIAAERLSRICYGMELDPGYCDVICQRYAEETGKIPVTTAGKKFEVKNDSA